MLDFKKILGRSWQILWNYRVLWIFGFVLALAAGGSSIGSNSRYTMNGGNQPSDTQRFDKWEGLHGDTFEELVNDALRQVREGIDMLQEEFPVGFDMVIAVAITSVVVLIVLGTLVAVLRYVSETAAIRMVDEYEESGEKVGFRQAWRYGWAHKPWRLFFANFLVHIPAMVLFVVLVLVGWRIFAALMGGVETTIISTVIAGSGLAFLFIFVTVVLMVFLYVVRDFAWRMIVLEDAGVWESLRGAAALLRRQWRNTGLMWLVMAGLKIAWGLAFIVLIFPLLVVSLITAVAGIAAALVPTLLTAGITSLFSVPDFWPWAFAAVVGAPFFFVVAFSPILLVGGWAEIYKSSVWTLTYRELKALEVVAPLEEVEENAALPGGVDAASA